MTKTFFPSSKPGAPFDSALYYEHLGILRRRQAALGQGNVRGGLFWGCEVMALERPVWREAALAVHTAARESLPPEQKHHLLPKEPLYFEKLLAGETGKLFGAFIGVELVGLLALRQSANLKAAQADGSLTCPQAAAKKAAGAAKGKVFTIQSLCVHPDFTGQKVSCFLLKEALAFAKAKTDFPLVFAQVAASNKPSWTQFLLHGFGFTDGWLDAGGNAAPQKKYLLRLMAGATQDAPRLASPDGFHIDVEKRAPFAPVVSALIDAALERGPVVLSQKPPGKGLLRLVCA